MQTNYLKYFVDIAHLGSAAAAAAENYMTPQGMSRSLSVLESELGCKLFDRQSNKMTLSEYGRRLLPLAIKMLDTQGEMENEVLEVREDAGRASDMGVVAYLANVAFDSGFIDPMTSEFEGLFANARFVQCDNAQVLENLLEDNHRDDELAIGLFCFFSPFERENQEVIAKLQENGFLYQQYLISYDMAVVSTRSELADKKTITRADMLSHPLIASNGDIAKVLERLYGEESVGMVTADSGFRLSMVERGVGISVVPAFSQVMRTNYFSHFEGIRAVPLKEPYYLEIGFAARREIHQSEYMKEFFSRLTSFYLRFSDTPYFTLVSSDLTALRSEAGDDMPSAEVLCGLEDENGLSKREREVFELMVVQELSSPLVAQKLGISLATAKSHIYNIYRKLGVHSHGDLMLLVDEAARSRK